MPDNAAVWLAIPHTAFSPPRPSWITLRLQVIARKRWGLELALSRPSLGGPLPRRQTLLTASFLLHADPPWEYFRNLGDSDRPIFFEECNSGFVLAASFPTNADPLAVNAWFSYLSRASPGAPAGRPALPAGSWVLNEAGVVSGGGLLAKWHSRDDSRRSRNLPAINQLVLELEPLVGGVTKSNLASALPASRVPWLLNTLLNELEYRSGAIKTNSIAPEFHISTTSACNIECRFCSYTHANALFRYLDLDALLRLDVLDRIETLRLSSGLGEPTLNPHLPAILEHLGSYYPHLNVNIFTNGLAWRRPGLVESFRNLSWINVSLNATTTETWKELCLKDGFGRVRSNLIRLRDMRVAQGRQWPRVHASTVLNRVNLSELAEMPSVCAELGISRLTAIPFFALGYTDAGKLNGDSSLHAYRTEYNAVFERTVEAAKKAGVTLEAPLPDQGEQVIFGVESRTDLDYAKLRRAAVCIEQLLPDPEETPTACPSLWKLSAIAATSRSHIRHDVAGYLYPCLGPLASHDFSSEMPVDYSSRDQYMASWNSPRYQRLRAAQTVRGLSPTCDACRGSDSRDPKHFSLFLRLRAEAVRQDLVQLQHF